MSFLCCTFIFVSYSTLTHCPFFRSLSPPLSLSFSLSLSLTHSLTHFHSNVRGDWALERLGAVLIEGATNIEISDCHFTRIDGNAIFLSGYSRGVQILRNEFSLLGNNAIASWGKSVDYDGTGGQQPRRGLIYGNVAHDIGLEQKQSSFYFTAQSCENTLVGNIVYNIPRAAINFEDNFGGATLVQDNLLFNTCRESSDHSSINSWSRMPYVTMVRDGITPSAIPAYTNFTRNFIVNNYAADGGCVDTDDVSFLLPSF